MCSVCHTEFELLHQHAECRRDLVTSAATICGADDERVCLASVVRAFLTLYAFSSGCKKEVLSVPNLKSGNRRLSGLPPGHQKIGAARTRYRVD
jgi:hypothetical protein